jgi:hypothetical protein
MEGTVASDAIALTHRWFEEVWNRGNEAVIDEMLARNAIGHGLGPEDTVGPEPFRAFYRLFREAFASIHITLDNVLESGGEVAYRGRARVTVKGTGETHELAGAGFLRYEGGQCVEGWNYWDFLSLLVQMRAVPADAVQATLQAAARSSIRAREGN